MNHDHNDHDHDHEHEHPSVEHEAEVDQVGSRVTMKIIISAEEAVSYTHLTLPTIHLV